MSVQSFIQYFQQCFYEQSQVEDILQALTFQRILKYEYGGPRVPPPKKFCFWHFFVNKSRFKN